MLGEDTGFSWATIGQNVLSSLATKLPTVATDTLSALIAAKIAPKAAETKAPKAAAPAPAPNVMAPAAAGVSLQKYMPYILAGGGLLAAYLVFFRKRSARA